MHAMQPDLLCRVGAPMRYKSRRCRYKTPGTVTEASTEESAEGKEDRANQIGVIRAIHTLDIFICSTFNEMVRNIPLVQICKGLRP